MKGARDKIGDTQSTARWLKEQGMKDREGVAAMRKSGGKELATARRNKREQSKAELESFNLRNKKF